MRIPSLNHTRKILLLIIAVAALLLPAFSISRFHAKAQQNEWSHESTQRSIQRRGGSAPSKGYGIETALSPFIDLQEQGLTLVQAGVGLASLGSGTANLSVNVGGSVRFAVLYWNGQDPACPNDGGACTVPTQPYKDQVIKFNGNTITGTIIGTETATGASNVLFNNIGYYADVTIIVNAAGTGMHSFTFADGDTSSNLSPLNGASLLVAYNDAADPATYRVLIWDGLDYAFGDAPVAGDERTTNPVTFSHGINFSTRTAQLLIVTGGGTANRPDNITISNNPTLFNTLDGSAGNYWDSDLYSISIPSGVGTTTVQVNSAPAGSNPDALLWQVAALRVQQLDTTPPSCSQRVINGMQKMVEFTIQDTDSGLAEIVVTQSNNADTPGPSFTVGTTDPVTVTATKINQSQPMRVMIRITDRAGNSTICSFDDSCISCPADIEISNDANQCGAIATFAATSPNACGTPTCLPASGSFFPKGTTTVNCSVTDAEMTTSTCSFTVTVNDTQKPSITCPGNITKNTDANACTAVATYDPPGVSDNCPNVGTPSCSPPSGTAFQKGTTTVTCSVSDASKNSNSCSFTVTVNDMQPPTLTCPGNMTKTTDANACTAVVNYSLPSISDNCPCSTGGAAPVKGRGPEGVSGCTVSCTPPPGTAFAKGTTTVTCMGADSSGNSAANCSFTVTVNDAQPPSITCPANITQSNDPNQCGAVVNYPAPTVSDNCPGVGSPTCSPASGSFFPRGTTTVNCSVKDASNNMAGCSFTITVNDTQPPTITCPANVTSVSPTPGGSVTVTYPPPSASDNCPGVMTACTPPSGSTFARGATTVTCTATDTSGNTATCSFSVAVFDGRLQDDSEGCNNTVLFNTATGDYRWCCHGTIFTGRAQVIVRGNTYTLTQSAADRRVQITLNAGGSPPNGNASLQVPPGKTQCTITDRDIRNDTCLCGAVSPPTAISH